MRLMLQFGFAVVTDTGAACSPSKGRTCSCSESGLAVVDVDFGQTAFSGHGVGRVSAAAMQGLYNCQI